MITRVHRLGTRVSVLVVATVVGLSVSTGAALASWTVTGTGRAVAAATSLAAPTSPRVAQAASSAVLSWAGPGGAGGPRGAVVDGFVVRRYPGVLGAVGVGTVICQTGPEARTCTDWSPPATGSSYVVSARSGSWETPATAVPLTVDPTAPSTAATTSPSPNSRGWITTTPAAVTLTATDGPAGSASGVASVSYRVNGGPVTTQAGATAVVTVLQQGTVQLDYWATDLAGNVENTRSLQLRLDSVPPATPGNLRISNDTGSSTSDLVTNAAQQTFTGTAEKGSTVELSYRGAVVGTTTAADDGTWLIGPQQLTAGSSPVSVRSIDAAGNSSAAATSTLLLDATAPIPTVTFPVANGSYTSTSWPKGCPAAGLCGAATDAGSGISTVSYELRSVSAGSCWNGSGFSTAACASLRTATGTSSWAVPVSYAAMPKGQSMRLTVYAGDVAGNRSAALVNTFTVK